jgi:hypothetical protein
MKNTYWLICEDAEKEEIHWSKVVKGKDARSVLMREVGTTHDQVETFPDGQAEVAVEGLLYFVVPMSMPLGLSRAMQ